MWQIDGKDNSSEIWQMAEKNINILRNVVKWQGNMGSGRKREIFCDRSGREIWKMVGKNKYSGKDKYFEK